MRQVRETDFTFSKKQIDLPKSLNIVERENAS
jgi:hypothetical protein